MTAKIKVAQSLKAYQRTNKENDTVSRSDKFLVDPRDICVREGFNVRELDHISDMSLEEYDAYVDGLAQAYRDGAFVPAIVVRVIDGKILVSEGHTRHKGMMRAINVYGADLKRVQVDEFKGNDAEEIALIATSQNNRKLKPLELARVYVRLENQGWSDKEIAQRMIKSVPHVIQTKVLDSMPQELKNMVNRDEIAAQAAMDLYDAHGTKATDIAKAMIEKAKEEDKSGKAPKRVTAKTAKPRLTSKETRKLNAATSSLYSTIKDIEVPEDAETVTVSLTPELLAQLKEIGERAHAVETFNPADLLNEEPPVADEKSEPSELAN